MRDPEANRATVKRHYQRNRPAMLEKFAARRRDFADFLNTLKSVPCADCGGRFPVECMDFDHVRGSKVANISRMHGHARERVMEEVAKCDVVCSNCHRIRTAARLKGAH